MEGNPSGTLEQQVAYLLTQVSSLTQANQDLTTALDAQTQKLLLLEASVQGEVANLTTNQDSLQTILSTHSQSLSNETVARGVVDNGLTTEVVDLKDQHLNDHTYLIGLVEDHHGEWMAASASHTGAMIDEQQARLVGDETNASRIESVRTELVSKVDALDAEVATYNDVLDFTTMDTLDLTMDSDYLPDWSLLSASQEWRLEIDHYINTARKEIDRKLAEAEQVILEANTIAAQALANTDTSSLVDSLQGAIGLETLDNILWGKVNSIDGLRSDISAKTAALRVEMLAKVAEAKATADQAVQDILSEAMARVDAMAIEAQIRSDQITLKAAELQDGITQESQQRIDGDTAVVGQLNAYKTSNDAALAAVIDDLEVTTTTQSATANQLNALTTTVNNNDTSVRALVATETTARSTADTALSNQITQLQSSTNTALAGKADASALNNYYTKTQADTATAGQISSFSSGLKVGGSNLWSVTSGSKVQETGTTTFTIQDKEQEWYRATINSFAADNTNRVRYDSCLVDTTIDFSTTDDVVVSGFIRASKATTMTMYAYFGALNTFVKTFSVGTVWTYFEYTAKASGTGKTGTSQLFAWNVNNSMLAVNDWYELKNVQMQFGTKATAFAPAIALTQNSLATTATAISGLDTRVTTAEGTITSQGTSITSLNNSLTTTNSNVTKALNAVEVKDTRSTNELPNWYWTNHPKRIVNEFKTASVIGVTGLGSYVNLETRVYYADSSGGSIIQIAHSPNDPLLQMMRRSSGGTTDAVWTAWTQPLKVLNDTINTKADSSALTTLDSKVTNIDGRVTSNASNITTLQGNITTINGALTNKADATALASTNSNVTALDGRVTANSNAITGLTSTVNSNTSAISNLQTTLATMDSASAEDVEIMKSYLEVPETTDNGLLTTDSTLVEATRYNYYATQVYDREATAKSLQELQANVDTSLASMTQYIEATVGEGITAQVTAITETTTQLNNQVTTISETVSSIDGIQGVKTVTIDNNGVMSGYGLLSQLKDGVVTSGFGINADQFYVGAPASGKKPFLVLTSQQTINGRVYPEGTWIDAAYIANATIGNAHIANLAVDSSKIADATIGTAKIADLAVTGAKIANASIDSAQIADAAITTAKIANAQITGAKIGDLQVDTLKIADYAVTASSGVVQPPTTYNVGHPNYYTSIAANKVYINERIILTHNFSTTNANGYTRIDMAVTSEWCSALGNSAYTFQNIKGTTWIDMIVDSQVVMTIKPSLYSDTYWDPGDEYTLGRNYVSQVYSYAPGTLYLKSLILNSGSHTLQLRLRTQSDSYSVYTNPSAVTPEYLRLGELTVMVSHFKK